VCPVIDNERYRTPLREALEQVGLSQARLARTLGVDRMQVVRWVQGEHTPMPERREEIAAILDGEVRAAEARAAEHASVCVTAESLWPHAYEAEAAA
jgi:transcriptional regulator with XRE-family HTH domain